LLLALVLLPSLAPPSLAGAASDSAAPYEPPTFKYQDGRIDVLEAVRLTLQHDPNLLLQQEDVRFQEGVVRQLKGAFDWVLLGNLSYDYKEKELRQSTIDRENQTRSELADFRDFSCNGAVNEQRTLDQLTAARNAQGGIRVSADQSIDAQLQFIEALIGDLDDTDRINALRQERVNLIDVHIAASRQQLGDLQGACTEAGLRLDRLGKTPEFEEFASGRLGLRGSKLFRNGIGIQPSIDTSYSSTNFVGKRDGYTVPRLDANGQPVTTEFGTPLTTFVDFGGKNSPDIYEAVVGFAVNLPLLRGRGDSVSASERAAKVDLEASAKVLEHGASESAASATLAFWSLLAAQQRVGVFERSAELQHQLVGITDALIDGDEVPRSERARALAGESGARAQLESARRDLAAARLNLVRVMGLAVDSIDNAPLAAGDFPTAPTPEAIAAASHGELTAAAVANRLDLQATRSLVTSGRILAEAARQDARSKMDLALTANANANGEDSFSNAVDRWSGPGGSIALSYEKLIGNNTRLGVVGQFDARRRQREISAIDLERTVRIDVVQTLAELADAVERLRQSEEAAARFQETTDAEVEKLRLGSSTLIDSILTEQQQTSAQVGLIAARQEVANLLAKLRFQSGLMVSGGAAGNRISLDSLTTLPSAAAAPGAATPGDATTASKGGNAR
jgi:outer membrane protein TolC